MSNPQHHERTQTNRRKTQPKKRRTKKRKKGAFLVKYLLFLIVCFAGMAVFFLLNHKVFNIKYVDLKGAFNITTEQVVDVLVDEDINSNIFLFSTGKAEEQVKKLPGVKECTIQKVYPNEVLVEIQEEFVIGYIKKGPDKYFVNQDGVLVDLSSTTLSNAGAGAFVELKGLPIPKSYEPGTQVIEDSDYLDLMKYFIRYRIYESLEQIDFENKDKIGIMYRGIPIHYGDLNEMEDKVSTLRAVIRDIEKRNVNVEKIYLDQGDNPVVVTK